MDATGSTTSADGTRVGWERHGAGPALVVLHGAGRARQHYRELARLLAGRFTVLLVDRRGRGLSGPARPGHGLEAELADLAAVLEATGAELVFGHSAGAVIALEAALRLPVRRVAAYEPPLARLLPLGWLPAFERALARGDPARAFALMARGLGYAPGWVPAGALALPVRLLMRGAEGRQTAALLPTVAADLATVGAAGDEARHAGLRAPALLLGGAASQACFRQSLAARAAALPRARRVELPGQGHNAPDQTGPAEVAAHLAAFFAEA